MPTGVMVAIMASRRFRVGSSSEVHLAQVFTSCRIALYYTLCGEPAGRGAGQGGERGRAGGERGKPLLADGWDRELRVSQDRSFHFLLSVILRKVFLLTRFL